MKVLIGRESFDGVMNRARTRADRMSRGEPIKKEWRITFERAEDLMGYLTPARLRLIRKVRERPLSNSALALSLERDRRTVTRDVKALRAAGLVQVQKAINPGHGALQMVHAVADVLELRAMI